MGFKIDKKEFELLWLELGVRYHENPYAIRES